MRNLLVFILVLLHLTTYAGEVRYPVSDIPSELTSNSYAVIREEVSEFRILAVNKSSHYVREVITILNPNGNYLAKKTLGYDANSKIQVLTAAIYDLNGNLTKKIRNSDIVDESAYDGITLYSDQRVKRIDLSSNTFPYTVHIEYEIAYRFLYFIPDFQLFEDDEVSIQSKIYSVAFPSGLKPRYQLQNVREPEHVKQEQLEKFTWRFTNLKPDLYEKFSRPDKSVPTIRMAPSNFEYGGYPGSMDTWENIGKWQLSLNKGRDVLPQSTKAAVAGLTAGKTDIEKIKVLYQYLQNKTRYVSIQLGIGGLQPFEAAQVDQLGYGDCKALSNYMVTLLREAGITGYYAWVTGGDNLRLDAVPDFPSNFGNHIIVCVPVQKDTVWLECTSQTQPFNFLGTFTGDRYALLITEKGGKLVRTPGYDKEKNVQNSSAVVTLGNTGRAEGTVKVTWSGAYYDHGNVGRTTSLGVDKQKEWIEKNLLISSFNIKGFDMKSLPGPKVEMKCELFLPACATVQGKRVFLQPNLMNKVTTVPEKLERRKTDIVLDFPFTKTDSIEFIIPEGLIPEFVPAPVKLSSPFGEYFSESVVSPGKVIYRRKMSLNQGTFPKESYNEFVEFFKSMNKADAAKLVLVTKT